MTDKIISVRMPVSLVDELKSLAEKNHFLDVSEAIRSLIRYKWLEFQDPYSAHLKDIRKKVTKLTVPADVNALKQDLKRLMERLNEI
ncbi:ribbon-helix-helix protein, CopG family [Candidatus Woesearchaeota archaeon]|nr:ribbon-helix-helix protein, CopG family [Candidatus Woesearchaeota archaeon]